MKQGVLYVLGWRSYAEPFLDLFEDMVVVSSDRTIPGERTPVPRMILFCGGQDISPTMYGERYEGPFYQENDYYIWERGYIAPRDIWEKHWFEWAVRKGVPMFGTCRGMQFFTVMTGGKLIQHVDNHFGNHKVYTHRKEQFKVNSIHHQMCVPKDGEHILLAWSSQIAGPKFEVEPEALFFPKVKALGVQWHPEGLGRHSDANRWVMKHLEEYLHVA